MWEVKDADVWLGCEVTGMGRDSGDMSAVKCSWERAFWANARYLRNPSAPIDARSKFWRCISLGIGDYHFAGWRPAIAAAAELEAAHNKIVSHIIGLKPENEDTAASYSIRRSMWLPRSKKDMSYALGPGGRIVWFAGLNISIGIKPLGPISYSSHKMTSGSE